MSADTDRLLARVDEARAMQEQRGTPELPEPTEVVPDPTVEAGYIDIVITHDDAGDWELAVRNSAGHPIEIGNWLTLTDGTEVFRLPYRPGGVTDRAPVKRGQAGHQVWTAADLKIPNTGTGWARVLGAIQQDWLDCGDGLTDEEIWKRIIRSKAEFPFGSVAGRRNQLVADGWLKPTGKTRRTTKNNEAQIWTLTDIGIEKLRIKRRGDT